MNNPVGGVTIGWHEIINTYNKIFSSDADVFVEFYDFKIISTDSIFLIVGKEKGHFKLNDIKLDLKIRTSRVFQKIEQQWYQIHHHGSIVDLKLLKLYLDAIHSSDNIL